MKKTFLFASAFIATVASATTIDTSVLGDYKITYTVTDSGGKTSSVSRIVHVVKNELPVITLSGGDITMYAGDAFVEPGFSALDKEDGDLSAKVVVTNNVDTAAPGVYKVVYTLVDSFGNSVSTERKVTVLAPNDIREKVIEGGITDPQYGFDLYSYLTPRKDSLSLLQKFIGSVKVSNQIDSFSSIDDNLTTKRFFYTKRFLSYEKQDSIINISFNQDEESLKSVYLDANVTLGSKITQVDSECKLAAHYNKVSLGGEIYDDVIKVVCEGEKEAYFQKDHGIILENVISAKNSEGIIDNTDASDLSVSEPKIDNRVNSLNWTSVIKMNADKIQAAPYNLSGKGVKVGLVDTGNVRDTHVEFSQVTNLKDHDFSSHSTHVAGTICAAGVKQDAKGFAKGVELYTVSYLDTYFGSSIKWFFDNKNVYITNHSYGYSSAVYLGEYESSCAYGDNVIYNNPYLIAIKASGNNRDDAGYDRYGITKAFANAKNIITVGSLRSDNVLSNFSSTGPVLNGRIKPDFVAKGTSIYSVSSDSDTAYKYLSGTSMATPAMTGLVALLEEEYLKINGDRFTIDTLKAILANSSVDLGRSGPDYEYGFGLPDAEKAVKIIDSMADRNTTLVHIDTLEAGERNAYTLVLDKESDVNLSLSWVEPGVSDAYDLICDLDMVLVDTNGSIYYPFTLNKNEPEEEAVTDKKNHVDTIEKIQAHLPAGEYKVVVNSSKMGVVSSSYSIVSSVYIKPEGSFTDYAPIDEFETTLYEEVSK